MTIEEAQLLLEKYYKGQCTPEQAAKISELLDSYVDNGKFLLDSNEKDELYEIIRERIKQETGIYVNNERKNVHRAGRIIFFRKIRWAAAVILVLFISTYFYIKKSRTEKENPVKTALVTDVQPGTTKATLVLANGKKVSLDSISSSGVKVVNGRVCLISKKGENIFLDRGPSLTVYNSIITKRGEQAPPVTLADGTKVWVNAASALQFPLSFTGSTREVTLSGEAYFEVAKDKQHPFIVNTGNNKIQVLGTHFDVMAYNDEPYTYATLLEGSIRINNAHNTALLAPGQQGKISSDGTVKVQDTDAEESIAWLHGKLSMSNMDIQSFMREVSRWYDVDIVYKHDIPSQSFSGNLNKNVPLSQILAALKANGIYCQLKDKTVTVTD